MLEAFNVYIKPAYDQLQKDLGVNKIAITVISTKQNIPVRIRYTSHSGNVVTRLAGTTPFYRSLGLMI